MGRRRESNESLKTILRIEDTENRWSVLIRILAGGVFFWEGEIKFLFVNQGMGYLQNAASHNRNSCLVWDIGVLEIIGGLSLILGLATKQWSLLFIFEMIVAMILTKIPLYFGTSPLAPPASPPIQGIWAVLHEIRSEYSQLLSFVYLFLAGTGIFSLDRLRKQAEEKR